MERRKILTSMLPLVVMFWWALPMAAQINRGVLQGIVTDPQGAVVPGVDVSVTSLDTSIATVTKTNATGYYRVGNLIPGKYRAHFELAGFSPLEMTDIEITGGIETRLDAQLKVGAARQTVEVTAQVGEIETAPTNYSTTLGSEIATDIPLAGRDLLQLAFLVPGVNSVGGPPGANFGFDSQYGTFPDPTNVLGSALEVNGGGGGVNAWYLDGNFNVSGIAENANVNPSPDAVQEFQVVSTAFAAEYGHTGGGVFNVVLKSGGNTLHGSAYEYLRNSATSARNPFTSVGPVGEFIPVRVLHFNDFGGTLGGPVYLPKLYNGKDKTFFFFSWDTNILHLTGEQVFDVPTAAMRAGDFSEVPNITQFGIYNPYSTAGPDSQGIYARSAFGTPITPNGCTGYIDPTTGLAVNPSAATCNFSAQIPATIPTPKGSVPGLNPVALYYLNSYPLPNFNNPLSGCPMGNSGFRICSNYLGGVGSSQVPHNISIKIDHQWSQRSKYFGEWLYNPGTYRNFRAPWTGPSYPNELVGYSSRYPVNFESQVVGLGNTYTLSPTTVNEFRANFTRQYMNTDPSALNQLMDVTGTKRELAPLNIPITSARYPVPTMYIGMPAGGSLTLGPAPWSNVMTVVEAYTVLDNITKVLGRHTLKTGFVFRDEQTSWAGGYPTQLYFNGGLDSNPVTGLGGGGGLGEFLMGAVNQGSTLGLSAPTTAWYKYGAGFVQDEFRLRPRFTLNVGLRYDLYGYFNTRYHPNDDFCPGCPNPTTGLPGKLLYEGDPGYPKGSNIAPANKTDFAPRFNFAWMPFHDQKTVVRGGYDIFYSSAVNALNNIGEASSLEPGWFFSTYWNASYYPSQCPSFSSHCVAFPLTPSGTGLGTLATPPLGTTYPSQQRDPLFAGAQYYLAKPSRDSMVQRWNLEIQRELPKNMLLSVGYIGNIGTHLISDGFRTIDYVPLKNVISYRSSINNVVPITNYFSGKTAAALAQIWGSNELPVSLLLTTFPAYGSVTQLPAFDGTNLYHAMNVRLQKRFSSGFTFILAYTWSKDITEPEILQMGAMMTDPIHTNRANLLGGRAGAIPGVVYGGIYQNLDNRKGDRALATTDIPQMFNFAWVYELPVGRGKPFLNRSRFLDVAMGGWKLSGTFNAQSGLPMHITGPCDQITCRPDLIGDPHFSGSRSKAQRIQQWMNPAAFEPVFGTDQNFWTNYNPDDPRAYLWGTAGAVLPNLRTPGFWNLDAALSKRLFGTEQKNLQLRWEVFNALNHMNLGYPNNYFCLPPGPNGATDLVQQTGCTFGRITDIQTDPRAMQFSLKFTF